MSTTTEKNKPNWLGFGAAVFFMILIIVGIIISTIVDKMNKTVTMTPGVGNGLQASRVALTVTPINGPQIK